MELYKRYIDDQNIVTEALPPGTHYNKEEDSLEVKDEYIEEDREVPADRRTFDVIRGIGESLEDMIQLRLTADVPSNYDNKRVPILDLEMWVERDDEGYSQVRWSFYEKKMKNKYAVSYTHLTLPTKA